jgi:hypothetical protein
LSKSVQTYIEIIYVHILCSNPNKKNMKKQQQKIKKTQNNPHTRTHVHTHTRRHTQTHNKQNMQINKKFFYEYEIRNYVFQLDK